MRSGVAQPKTGMTLSKLYTPAIKFSRSFNWRSFQSTILPLHSPTMRILFSSVDVLRGLPLFFWSFGVAALLETDLDSLEKISHGSSDFIPCAPYNIFLKRCHYETIIY